MPPENFASGPNMRPQSSSAPTHGSKLYPRMEATREQQPQDVYEHRQWYHIAQYW